ncbi:MAG: hypothetical protein BIFFINMI_03801 [Phycisphaerae bacterium]|nr:hypothetical protein [Phycisphaerae bacterium]
MSFPQVYRLTMLVNVAVLAVMGIAGLVCGRPREGAISLLFAASNTLIFW